MSSVYFCQKVSQVLIAACAGLLFFLSVPSYGFAQTDQTSTEPTQTAGESEGILVATLNIQDATISKQDNRNVAVSFMLANREGVQPDVRYGVTLTKLTDTGEPTSVGQSFFYDGEVALSQNESIPITFGFVTPEYLPGGEYDVQVVATNASGINLGFATAGTISLPSGQGVIIEGDTCTLVVDPEKAEKTYQLDDGVDVGQGESFLLACYVMNEGKDEVSVSPLFQTYRRNRATGIVAETEVPLGGSVVLTPQSRTALYLSIPKALTPQSYDVVVALADTQGVKVSNEVVAHYVLQGLSGTIQNIVLDKDNYKNSDTGYATVTISKSADAFPDARNGGAGTEYGDVVIEISLHDVTGEACIAPTRGVIDGKEKAQVQVPFLLLRDCVSPIVSAKLVNLQDNTVLDEMSGSLGAKPPVAVATETAPVTNGFNVITNILITILIIVIVGVIIAVRRTHTQNKIPLALFIFVSFTLFSIVGVSETHADTILTDNGASWIINLTYNINKSNYKVGDEMSISVSGAYLSCTNNYKGALNSYIRPNQAVAEEWLAPVPPPPPPPPPCVPILNRTCPGQGGGFMNGGVQGIGFMGIVQEEPSVKEKVFSFIDDILRIPKAYGRSISVGYTTVKKTFTVASNWNPVNPNASFRFYYRVYHKGRLLPGEDRIYYRSIPYTLNVGPVVSSFTATPNPVPYGTSATLNWASLETTSCTASADWSGTKGALGSESTGPITAPKTYTLRCTGPGGDSAPVTVTVQVSCGSQTINGCTLPQANTGVSIAGICTAGYAGGCNASCVNGQWTMNNNTCSAPLISDFRICEAGQVNCVSSGTKSVPVSTPIEIHWNASNASFCSASGGSGFSTSNAISGVDTATVSSVANTTELYGIVCGNAGVPGVSRYVSVTTYPAVPVITASPRLVEQGTRVTLTYNTAGQTCTLTGVGSVTGTGSSQVTVQAQTQYVLDCPVADASVTVEIVPKGFET